MVFNREELEKKRQKNKKRRRIIWLSILGAFVLLIAVLLVYQFTDLIVPVPQGADSSPQPGEWSMFHHDESRSGNLGTGGAQPQGNLKWTFTTGAAIHSSPCVVDGTVYFGSQDHSIYAVDAATGAKKWLYETGSWVESSPIVVGGVLYCGSNDGNLYALNAQTGAKIWSCNMHFTLRSSPAYANGIVYIGDDDYSLYAVNADTGKIRWHHKTDNIVVSSPVITGGVAAVGSADGLFYTFNAKNGRVRLQFKTNGATSVTSSPAIKDGVGYFTDTSGWVYAVDVRAKNWLWENKIRLYWNVLYVYGVAPNPSKPSGLLWDYSLGFGIVSTSSPAMSGDVLYVGAGKNVVAFNVTAKQVLWTFNTNDLVLSSPALADTALYFGSEDGHLYALDKATGAKLWDVTLGDIITSSPALADGSLYIGCNDGKMYAFN
jgi:outer membrane protein assembly factor BamB